MFNLANRMGPPTSGASSPSNRIAPPPPPPTSAAPPTASVPPRPHNDAPSPRTHTQLRKNDDRDASSPRALALHSRYNEQLSRSTTTERFGGSASSLYVPNLLPLFTSSRSSSPLVLRPSVLRQHEDFLLTSRSSGSSRGGEQRDQHGPQAEASSTYIAGERARGVTRAVYESERTRAVSPAVYEDESGRKHRQGGVRLPGGPARGTTLTLGTTVRREEGRGGGGSSDTGTGSGQSWALGPWTEDLREDGRRRGRTRLS